MSKKSTEYGLATRFGMVRGYFIDHVGTGSYMPIFSALDPELKNHEKQIRRWWNSHARVEPEHERVIERMERVIEVLKNAPSITENAA